METWGYLEGQVKPEQWGKHYRTGALQSPINIQLGGCERHLEATRCRCRADSASGLADELAGALRVAPEAAAACERRRAHLNWAGEEEEERRRPGSQSAALSSSSSPVSQAGDSDEDSGADLHDSRRATPIGRASNRAQGRHPTNCPPSAGRQNTRFCTSAKKIFLGYPRYLDSVQICNTGHGWQVNVPPELATHTLLCGPPLGDREYRLAQFHCHWGEDCNSGSEHQIDGKSFSAEIHFVHWNCTDFSSMEEASKHKHGLAVLAVLLQALEGDQNRHKHLDKVIANLRRIHKPGSSVMARARLDLKKLFPPNRWSYATYEGSLTTPPLSEVVDWIVFLKPIQCSSSQIDQFRQLRCPSATGPSNLTRNCRPIQPTNDRLVTIWSHH